MFLGGVVFFFILCSLFWLSDNWAKELPEYTIKEAEKIFEMHSAGHDLKKLKDLIRQAKQDRKTDKLKEWIEMFIELKSVRKLERKRDSLSDELNELKKKIIESEGRRSELRLKLFF